MIEKSYQTDLSLSQLSAHVSTTGRVVQVANKVIKGTLELGLVLKQSKEQQC